MKAKSTSVSSAVGEVLERPRVLGRLDDDLVGADPVHPVVDPLRLPVEVALDLEGGEPVRDDPHLPARASWAAATGGGRRRRPRGASCPRGPGRTGTAPAGRGGGQRWRSEGRRARSVAMITQRPTIGSLRSSGIGSAPRPCARGRPVRGRRSSRRGRRRAMMTAPPRYGKAMRPAAEGPGAGLGADDPAERGRRLADAERAALVVARARGARGATRAPAARGRCRPRGAPSRASRPASAPAKGSAASAIAWRTRPTTRSFFSPKRRVSRPMSPPCTITTMTPMYANS